VATDTDEDFIDEPEEDFDIVKPVCYEIKPASSKLFEPTPIHIYNRHLVLIVDDTDFNRYILENMLNKFNIICHHASEGQEAINKVMLQE